MWKVIGQKPKMALSNLWATESKGDNLLDGNFAYDWHHMPS